MSNGTIGFVLMVLGVVIALVSMVAYLIRIGNQLSSGWKQLLREAFDVILAIVRV
jgi:hypothetical protein